MIKEYFEKYLNYVLIYRKEGTYKFYKKVFRSLEKAFNYLEISQVDEMKEDTLDKLIIYYREEVGMKNSKINDTVSAFFSVVNKYNLIIPFRQIKLNDDTKSFTMLSDEEIKLLLKYCSKQDLTQSNNLSWILGVYLLLDTGARINELLNIKIENIDLINQVILLEETKNSKKRIVFYGELSKDLITRMLAINKNKFLLWNFRLQKKMSVGSFQNFFWRFNKEVKTKKSIHAHRLRKTFATKLLRKGCPLLTIQKILGHSSIRQTMIYLEIDNEIIAKDYKDYYPY